MMTSAHSAMDCRPVMVVDDDDEAREVIRDVLESDGYKVVTATNGKEALALLAGVTPCMILLDLLMPVMNGVQFLAAYRSAPLAQQDLPIVVVSAYDHLAAGLPDTRGFLAKPVELQTLLQTVRKFC